MMSQRKYQRSLPSPFHWSAIFEYQSEVNGMEPHAHQGFQFTYTLAGDFFFELNSERYPAPCGTLSVVSPGLIHQWSQNSHAPSALVYTAFCASVAPQFLGSITDFFAPWIRNEFWQVQIPLAEVHNFTDRMIQSNESPILYREAFDYALNLELLVLFCNAVSQGLPTMAAPKKGVSDALKKVLYYMDIHAEEQLTLEQIASVACLSPSRFSAVFTQKMGCSPMHYLIRLRIDRAKVALTYGTQPIKDIAEQNGFQSLPYFCRTFSRLTGIPPGEYRLRTQTSHIRQS